MATKKQTGRRLQLGEEKASSSAGAAGQGHDVVEIVDIVEPETPARKRSTKSRSNHDDDGHGNEDATSRFFTPQKSKVDPATGAATITPSPAARKRRALLTEAPEKEKKRKVSKSPAKTIAVEDEEPYVPKYIHANVGYRRFGSSNNHLLDGQKMAFSFIADNYTLPPDFETNRKYGPLSGLCYEERAIAAYSTNMLEPKEDADLTLLKRGVCTSCGTVGHERVRCPDLI